MAFGFDPSIILSATRTQEPTPNETLRTLADLAGQRQHMRQSQATLADLAQTRQREASLADIYRQGAADPVALPSLLMRGGFGAQAFQAQDQASQLRAQEAERLRRLADIQASERKQIGELFADVQDQAGWDMVFPFVPEAYRPHIGKEYDAKKAKGLKMLGIPPEQREKLAQRDEELAARTAEGAARRQAAAERDRAAAARRDAAAAAKADAAAAKDAKKGGEKTAKAYLEGFELSPEAQPSNKEVESLRAAQATINTMKQTIGKIRGLYQKYGNSPLPGPAKAQMSALTTDLMLRAKSDAVYALGVIAGPDLDLLTQLAPNVTSREATLLDFVGDDQSMARITTLGEQLDRGFANSARARGFRPKGKAAAKAAPAKAAGGLSAEEARELAELEAELGGGQ